MHREVMASAMNHYRTKIWPDPSTNQYDKFIIGDGATDYDALLQWLCAVQPTGLEEWEERALTAQYLAWDCYEICPEVEWEEGIMHDFSPEHLDLMTSNPVAFMEGYTNGTIQVVEMPTTHWSLWLTFDKQSDLIKFKLYND